MRTPDSLSFQRLLDWVEGRLPEAEAAQVTRQVARADPSTRELVAWLRAFQKLRHAVILETPPPEVREILRQRFAAYCQEQRPPSIWRRLAGVLLFDSRTQPGLVGLRSQAAQVRPRQLIYTTEVADLALHISQPSQQAGLDLSGQIFLLDESATASARGFVVQLLHGETEMDLTMTDELGEFSFTGLPPGRYDLILGDGHQEIVISEIELTLQP